MLQELLDRGNSVQNPKCPLCGKFDNEKIFSSRGHDLLACSVCELLFINPYPEDVDKRHNVVAKSQFEELEILGPQRHYLVEVQYYKEKFPLIEEECRDAKSLLDVGCGTGHLLELLGEYPSLFRCGIELNAARAQLARQHAGCEICQVPIEKFESEGKFDVILMINVLSHIPSFDRLFESIGSLLSRDGKLIIKSGEFSKDIKKGDVFDWGIPDHMNFLGLKTLDFICSKYGFNLSKHRRVPFSEEYFSRERFAAPGRSSLRNAMKLMILYTPFALSVLRKLYDMKHSQRSYSSFAVLVNQT